VSPSAMPALTALNRPGNTIFLPHRVLEESQLNLPQVPVRT
jgi:hypothetical protein